MTGTSRKVYGKQEAFESLKPSLTEAIQSWMDSRCDDDEWETLSSYVGENIAGLMSKAAMSVLEGVVDVQDYLKKDGTLS